MEANTFFSGKNILITGGAGFIGSHLCEHLSKMGAHVLAVDNLLTGKTLNIEPLRGLPNFTFLQADVNQSPESYLPVHTPFDLIFHFASPASPPRYQEHPVETYLVNSYATHLLAQYLLKTNPKGRLIFAGTSEAYGDPAEHPQKESYWGNVNPNGVRSCYDEAKRLGETICGVHFRNFHLDTRIVRIFNTYGPRMDANDGRIIPSFITEALNEKKFTVFGTGKQTRSYCYIDDLVRGILSIASQDNLAGETINLGNPQELTALDTAKMIWNLTHPGKEMVFETQLEFHPLPKDDPTRRQPDITKAKRLLNWEPQVDLQTGLQKTIEYFRSVCN